VRERWVAARRAEGRRRLRVLVAAVALVGGVAIAYAVTRSPLLDVDHLAVRGAQHTPVAAVERAAGIHTGAAMAWIDTGRAAHGIEALPYVLRADVVRSWPDTVRITVTERTPVAWVDDAGRHAVVDGSGRVLALVSTPPAGLPQLAVAVPAGAHPARPLAAAPGAELPAAFRSAAEVAGGLGPYVAPGTKVVTAGPTGVTLQLASGPEVRMGDPDDVLVKVKAAFAVIGALGATTPHYVDVSVPTNPVAG